MGIIVYIGARFTMKTLDNRLKLRIEKLAFMRILSDTELARALNISRQTLIRYKNRIVEERCAREEERIKANLPF
jgi:DNA invertase Pin-like site-specific DNA recombinase